MGSESDHDHDQFYSDSDHLIMNFVVTFDNAIMGLMGYNQIQPCQPSPSFQDIDLTLSLSRGMNIASIKAQGSSAEHIHARGRLEAQHGDNPIHETVLDWTSEAHGTCERA